MRNLVVNTFLTLDGVMQGPGGPEEDTSNGFAQGGWTVPYFDDAVGEAMGESMADPFELVLGRRTYEIFAAHWPNTDEPPAELFNNTVKHVASTTLRSLDWAGSQLIEGDVSEAIGRLKEQDGPQLMVVGSATLIQTLLANGLVDELQLLVFPVVVGSGKRLFGDGAVPAGFELSGSKASASGVLIASYRAAGELQTGSFALDEAA
jgi:dihydrofolate reductase